MGVKAVMKDSGYLKMLCISKDSAICISIPTLTRKTLDLSKFKLIELADQIGDSIWDEVNQWRQFEKDTIGKQLVRAADSISANLSEAFGRYSFQDRKRFAYYARGSLCETINWLSKSTQRKLIKEVDGEEILSRIKILSYKLNAYIKSLKQPRDQTTNQ